MDDIYFTDKKDRKNDNGNRTPQKDRFKESDYEDISSAPSLKKRSKGNEIPPRKGKFTVNIPEEALNDTVNRTPQGQRRVSSQPYSRVPSGQRIGGQNIPRDYRPMPPSAPPQPQRTPAGAPVKNNKKDIRKKIAVAVSVFILVFIVGIFAYGYSVLGNLNYDDSIVANEYVNEDGLAKNASVKNILIIGSDVRDGQSGQRSDSMILFSIDKKNRQIKLTSFLRDSYVFIPGEGYEDKLNASFSLGGPQLTMDTIEYNFGVDIDSYVIIDFNIFTQFIDLLGGVTIEGITENEADYMLNELQFLGTEVGTNHLNGIRTLWYCRMRYLDDDFHRTERQRKVIQAVIKKMTKTSPFTLLDIVKQVTPNIATNISRNELIGLGANALVRYLRYKIVQQQIPAEGTWWDDDINGASVIVLNTEKNAEILQEFIYGEYKAPATTEAPEEEDDYYYDEEDYYYDDEEYYY